MFSEAMTSKQLLAEYRQDLPDIRQKALRFKESPFVGRFLQKRKKQKEVAITQILTSKRGNRYMALNTFVRHGSGDGRQIEWTCYHIGLMTTKKGLCAITIFEETGQTIKFMPHFFGRYRERFAPLAGWEVRNQLAASKSVTETMAVYFKRNIGMTWIETNSVYQGKVHIFSPVNDGVALMEWDRERELLQVNTFISFTMLNEDQLRMVGYANTYKSLSPREREACLKPCFANHQSD